MIFFGDQKQQHNSNNFLIPEITAHLKKIYRYLILVIKCDKIEILLKNKECHLQIFVMSARKTGGNRFSTL